MADKIFINYRREESGHVAGRLHDRLAQVFGQDNIFMDVDTIPVGEDFVAYLNSQVAACDVVLAVIGRTWLKAKDKKGQLRLHQPDDFVAIELAAALTGNVRVIPILVDGARMPGESELPDPLRPLARRQAAEVRHASFGKDAEALVARMRKAIAADLAAKVAEEEQKLAEAKAWHQAGKARMEAGDRPRAEEDRKQAEVLGSLQDTLSEGNKRNVWFNTIRYVLSLLCWGLAVFLAFATIEDAPKTVIGGTVILGAVALMFGIGGYFLWPKDEFGRRV